MSLDALKIYVKERGTPCRFPQEKSNLKTIARGGGAMFVLSSGAELLTRRSFRQWRGLRARRDWAIGIKFSDSCCATQCSIFNVLLRLVSSAPPELTPPRPGGIGRRPLYSPWGSCWSPARVLKLLPLMARWDRSLFEHGVCKPFKKKNS